MTYRDLLYSTRRCFIENLRDFPGGPVFRTLPSNAGSASLIPGQGTMIPYALWLKKQNKTKPKIFKKRSNIVTNSIKSLKNSPHQKKSFKKIRKFEI